MLVPENNNNNNTEEYNNYLQTYLADDGFSVAGASCALTASTLAEGIAHTISHWKILIFGQGLAVLLTGIGATSSTLVDDCRLNAPTFQFGLLYVCLSMHFFWMYGKYLIRWYSGRIESVSDGKKDDGVASTGGDALAFDDDDLGGVDDMDSGDKRGRPKYTLPCTNMPIRGPWWFYFVIAVLDVEANFFTILAFRYTTLTSVTLFDSLAIPGAMITSKMILGSKYGSSHVIGALVCLLGVVVNVLVDLEDLNDPETGLTRYPHKLLGDVLAIAGGTLYGVNDALEELVVRRFSVQEYLGFVGLFGTIISILQAYILELDDVVEFFNGTSPCSSGEIFWLLLAFMLINYLSYIGTARFLVISEAALLNLSLLTSDLYAVLWSVFEQNIIPDPVFFMALLLIFSGVVIYEIAPSPKAKTRELISTDFVLEFGKQDDDLVKRPGSQII